MRTALSFGVVCLGLSLVGCSSVSPTQPLSSSALTVSNPQATQVPRSLAEAESRRSEIALPTLEELEPLFEEVLRDNARPTEADVLAAAWPRLVAERRRRATQGVTYNGTYVTWSEFALLANWPWYYQPTKKASDDAAAVARSQWPNMAERDTKLDAFRHGYWNILLSKRISTTWAERFTTAHEAETPDGYDRRMDLSNNQVGRLLYGLSPSMSEGDQAKRLKGYRYELTKLDKNQMPAYLVYIK